MIDTVILATDGSDSVARAVAVGLDLARRFDATLHALFVIDDRVIASAPSDLREEFSESLVDRGKKAVERVTTESQDDVVTSIRRGQPPIEITRYAKNEEADLIVMGTRGRHGSNRFVIGSVAESVVRTCPIPVLTVRQLE